MNRLIIAVALVCGSAGAVDLPVSSSRDGRVQYVNYHDADVVLVPVDVGGRFTQIVLEKGEAILNYVIANPDGYDVNVAYNAVTVRPVSVQVGEVWVDPNKDWDTNLSITTEKRIYLIDLETSKTPAYMVKYSYPTEAEMDRLAVVEQKAKAAIKEQPKPIDVKNVNYTAKLGKKYTHSETILPLRVYDDGAHTFIELPPHGDMPLVFTGSGEEETLTNSRVEAARPHTIRVTTIAEKLTLRVTKGKIMKVVTITNRSFPKVQE